MKTEIEISLTPDQLAELYVHWDSSQQANFMNLIGRHFKDANFDAEWQCCYTAKDINKDGRDFIYTLANFIKVRGIPSGSPKEDVLINSYPCESLNERFYLDKYNPPAV